LRPRALRALEPGVAGSVAGAALAQGNAGVLAYLSRQPLRQPDHTTCGSATLVMARMLIDADYAADIISGPTSSPIAGRTPGPTRSDDRTAQNRFSLAALDLHRTTNGLRAADGAPQIPWPKSLGTSPWGAARHLSELTGVRYRVAVLEPGEPARGYDRLAPALDHRQPCALFIGNSLMARHVILVIAAMAGRLTVYEPSAGEVLELDLTRFHAGEVRIAGWNEAWFLVAP
jgi:hypothetical protein